MTSLILAQLRALDLQNKVVVHHLALDGVWHGVVKMKLAGEDAQAYASPVMDTIESLAYEVQQIVRTLDALVAFFTKAAPRLRRLRRLRA